MQAVKTNMFWYGCLDRVDIAAPAILNPARPAYFLGLSKLRRCFQQCLNRQFVLIGQFEAIGTEQLYAIIFIRIMAGGNHHTQVSTH